MTNQEQLNPLSVAANSLMSAQRGLCKSFFKKQQPKQMFKVNRSAPARVSMRSHPFAAIIPGDSVVEQVMVSGLDSFLNLYNSALVARLVLTWFPNPPEIIVGPLSTVCDPYLNLFRGILPPLGMMDLSPILAFVTLNLFTGAAAALPCELGPDGRPLRPAGSGRLSSSSSSGSSGPFGFLQLSRYQQLWENRMQAQRQARQQRGQ